MLTQEYLHSFLDYDKDTGVFTRKVKMGVANVGDVAGYVTSKYGYRQIRILRKKYYEHRLAWLYVYGEWPVHEIDHINNNKCDNRISNLRDVTHAENMRTTNHKVGRTGYRGVRISRDGKKYQAVISIKGRCIPLGTFDCPVEAHKAHLAARVRRENATI
jgi:hypothetical protein